VELHVFGSIIRGEIHPNSDIDVLAIPVSLGLNVAPKSWSVYSKDTLSTYFREGKLFAWHLYLESKLIYSPLNTPFLSSLGAPASYRNAISDIETLTKILESSINELASNTPNVVFELGLVYTAIRDIAMSASWHMLSKPSFSSNSPYLLPLECPLPKDHYNMARLARHISTRGGGPKLNPDFHSAAASVITAPIRDWANQLRDFI